MSGMTIGRLATAAGVGIDTVRFYEREGLLPRPRRTASGYRQYAEADAERLRFIRRAKTLGFTLDEVGELLALNDGKGSRAGVKALTEKRLAQIEQSIADLQRMRGTLAALASHCSGQGSVKGCPIIDAVLGKDCHQPHARRPKS
jgi:MerR family copper efflux transcriptional regulator